MYRSIWHATVALGFVAGCSGDGGVDLTGVWYTEEGRQAMEFLSGDRFTRSDEVGGAVTWQGTYTARDGLLTMFYDHEPSADGALARIAGPFWTDGDRLEVAYYSPDHDGDAIVGTWRSEIIVDYAFADGTVQTTETQYVSEFAPDGTVVDEVTSNGFPELIWEGTYTAFEDEVIIQWGVATEVRTVRDRRMDSLVYVRSE